MAWSWRNYNAAIREIHRQLDIERTAEGRRFAQSFYRELVSELGPGITGADVRRWFEKPEDWLEVGDELEISAETRGGFYDET